MVGIKRLRRSCAVLVAVTALVTMMVAPASAVTNGELDGEGHPYVGIMVAKNSAGTPMWRCTGTLLSATVFLTAGHCTESPAASVEIWFHADMQTNAAALGYPNTGQVSGIPHTHPQYDPTAFYLFDLGIVTLNTPFPMATYGTLPTLDQLDSLKPGPRSSFTSVGYGLQRAFPDAASWKDVALKIRMVAHPQLLQINNAFTGDGSLLLSNNANTAGTCFGDSGGPNFLGTSTVIAGVTSFGINPTCAGTGGVYRIDRADDLAFINSFLTP